jgi:hypothetical protein
MLLTLENEVLQGRKGRGRRKNISETPPKKLTFFSIFPYTDVGSEMPTKSKKRRIYLTLLLFAGITLAIDFFHCEKGLSGTASCPACQFKNSTLATGQTMAFEVPKLVLVEQVSAFEAVGCEEPFIHFPVSRSPPKA